MQAPGSSSGSEAVVPGQVENMEKGRAEALGHWIGPESHQRMTLLNLNEHIRNESSQILGDILYAYGSKPPAGGKKLAIVAPGKAGPDPEAKKDPVTPVVDYFAESPPGSDSLGPAQEQQRSAAYKVLEAQNPTAGKPASVEPSSPTRRPAAYSAQVAPLAHSSIFTTPGRSSSSGSAQPAAAIQAAVAAPVQAQQQAVQMEPEKNKSSWCGLHCC